MCLVLEAEKLFIEAAKRNDVETMRTIGRGLNANAKNVVSAPDFFFFFFSTLTLIVSPKEVGEDCKSLLVSE